MKIKTGNGAFLLVALVQSQQKALTKNDNLKFEAFEPVKRKKRIYKRKTIDQPLDKTKSYENRNRINR